MEEEAHIREIEEKKESEMKRLQKASEWIQAHWKGFVQRNDKQMKKGLTKLRKKKKKLRKKGMLGKK